tara:strand:- start:566 stop:694 length:129 start_codon:yes stop_codon:yes gene_type:complete
MHIANPPSLVAKVKSNRTTEKEKRDLKRKTGTTQQKKTIARI